MGLLGSIAHGVSGAASAILPFDPTPGFNLTTSTAGVPLIAKQGTGAATTSPTSGIQKADSGGIQKADAGAPTPTSSVYTGSTSAASSAAAKQTAADSAAYQDQITALNQLLSSADATRASGTQSLNDSYNNNLSRLNQQQSDTLSKYATQRSDTGNDYQKALQTINGNARNGYNSLQALLGGTGSAGTILAPFAVSQQANQQRGTSSDSYAKNLRDLDTATTSAEQGYKNSKDDLYNQNQDKLRQLIASIDSQKQNYLSQRDAATNQLNIARGGGYVSSPSGNAIQSLLNEQNGLNSAIPDTNYTVNPVTVATPDLANYQSQAAQLAQGSNVDDGSDDVSAALAALLKQNQDNTTSSFAY